MGIINSKQSSHTPSSSLSFLDRRAKSISKGPGDTQSKRHSNKRSKRRLSLLSRYSKMENRDTSSSPADGESATMSTDAPNNARRSSRRRTRSIALLQHSEADTEDDSEPTTSRRIRRRIKGKSKQVEAEEKADANACSSTQTKGKRRQTQEDEEMEDTMEAASRSSQVEVEEHISSTEEAMSKQISMAGQTSAGTLLPIVDPPQLPTVPSNTAAPQQMQQGAVGAGSNPNPYELTNEDRIRAREQIARALGVGAAAQLATPTARPSVLSALLTDILGLRGGPAVPADSIPGSQTNLGGSTNPIPRSRSTNGGTSVIVQGALISRTLPSRPSTSSNAAEDVTTQEVDGASTMRRSQSQPAVSTAETTQSSVAEPSPLIGTEMQVATIEEQAAMLIRLLSIATAATAASLVSRTPPQQGHRQSSGSTSTGTNTNTATTTIPNSTSSMLSTPYTPSTPRPSAPMNDTSSPMTNSSSSPSSLSSSWLQASQTYQGLRDRFHSLRSRFRGLRAAAQTEREQASALQQAMASSQPTQDITEARHSAEAEASRAEEEAAGSLRSLSSMLQDAIRDGVTSSERGAARPTESNETTASSRPSPFPQSPNSQFQNVHATLEAVRGGNLVRGSPSSFDRFLFDLMGDLDVAIRGLPRDNQVNEPVEQTASTAQEDTVRHRRNLDVHDGQLSFYRQFTFHEAARDNENNLLPCVVVGVRNLEPNSRSLRIERVNAQAETGVFLSDRDEDMNMEDDEPSTLSNTTTNVPTTAERATPSNTSTTQEERPMSRFLLFVSGGHYPRSHPVFFSSRQEASRDLMILMEFLGAMASMHTKPNSTVTKDQIEKSKIRKVNGDLEEIASLVKEDKIKENTSERCLICLEDWQNEDEDRRLLECAHLFHAPCIDQWLTASNNSCPLCRRQAVTMTLSNNSSPAIEPSTTTSLAE